MALMIKATASDRDYFRRVERGNRELSSSPPPASLAEMFERLETAARQLGSLAAPGRGGSSDGDLSSHLAYLHQIHSVDAAQRT
jgi:hypothetical protein